MRNSDNKKNGNKEGTMLFFHKENPKETLSIIMLDSDKISKPRNRRIKKEIIVIIIFFI